MKKIPAILVALIMLTGTLSGCQKPKAATPLANNNAKYMLTITSSSFNRGDLIPARYTCDGSNINPDLYISGTPLEAKSLVVMVDDPDSANGSFCHWLIYNIDPKTTQINESSVPAGATLGVNDFGHKEYGGPCPPKERHRYFFKVYALSENLNLPEGLDKNQLAERIANHIIAQGEIMGLYQRQQ